MTPDDFEHWRRTMRGRNRLALERGEDDDRITSIPCPPGPNAITHMVRSEQRIAVCHDARCHVTSPHPAHSPESAR